MRTTITCRRLLDRDTARQNQESAQEAHKKLCREQKITEDHAAREQVANEKAARDAHAEQLATESLMRSPSTLEQEPRVICYIDENGAAVSVSLDGVQHVQPEHTYVLRYLPPAAQGEKATCQYYEFTATMVAAMEHMTENEKAAYHLRVQDSVIKQWEEEDGESEVADEKSEEEYKKANRLARKLKAEEATKCLNERA